MIPYRLIEKTGNSLVVQSERNSNIYYKRNICSRHVVKYNEQNDVHDMPDNEGSDHDTIM